MRGKQVCCREQRYCWKRLKQGTSFHGRDSSRAFAGWAEQRQDDSDSLDAKGDAEVTGSLFAVLLVCGFAWALFGQQRVFNWLPGNNESVRLDPANYHAGQTYHAGGDGGNMQVDIKSELPVTIFLARSEEWSGAVQHPEGLSNLQQLCTREHVVETRYSCFVPPVSMTLVIRDERNSPDQAIFAGLGAVLDPKNKTERAVGEGITAIFTGLGSAATRRFKAPNDVHVQYFRWLCVENCVQAQFEWTWQVKEKYNLTSFLK